MPDTAAAVSVLDALEHHADRDPGHPFVVDLTPSGGPDTWSYGRAREDVGRIARGLAGRGVRRGDRVALRLRNSWSFVAVLLGALRAGAIPVPTICQYSPAELRYALEDCGATCLVFDDADADAVRSAVPADVAAIAAGFDAREGRTLDELRAAGDHPAGDQDVPVIRARDDAMIFYTSGTTSRPKGVVLTHGAILDSCLISAEGLRLQGSDRSFVVLPLFHCNALFIQLVPLLLTGATAVISDRFSASGYLDALRRHEITFANLTAGAVRSVLAQPERADDRDHRLRMLMFALPLREEEIRRIERRFGIPVYMAYGLTESCCGGTRTPLHLAPRGGWQSLGLAQSGWEVAVLDERGERLAFGEAGEIALRGPGVMDRYWNRAEATAEAKRGGWLHTGDLGVQNAAGYLYFRSRAKDMLKPKGENVAASEIEAVLDSHAAVIESAVVGIFDPHHEERIVAFLSGTGDEQDTDDVRAHCRRRLAGFKVPSEFRWVEELPHTSIGKVNKGALRALASNPGGA